MGTKREREGNRICRRRILVGSLGPLYGRERGARPGRTLALVMQEELRQKGSDAIGWRRVPT